MLESRLRRKFEAPVGPRHQAAEANRIVAEVHPKAMPVILTTKEEIETWLTAPSEEALKLQRTFDGLEIVARGKKKDVG